MIVLDTNVVSVMVRPETAPQVLDWLDDQPVQSIWTTAVTLFEIGYGLAVLPQGRRRSILEANFERVLHQGLADRVLDFDTTAAFAAADLMAHLRIEGIGCEIRDLQIAGIVIARRGALATRNVEHFEATGVTLVNPWDAPAS